MHKFCFQKLRIGCTPLTRCGIIRSQRYFWHYKTCKRTVSSTCWTKSYVRCWSFPFALSKLVDFWHPPAIFLFSKQPLCTRDDWKLCWGKLKSWKRSGIVWQRLLTDHNNRWYVVQQPFSQRRPATSNFSMKLNLFSSLQNCPSPEEKVLTTLEALTAFIGMTIIKWKDVLEEDFSVFPLLSSEEEAGCC